MSYSVLLSVANAFVSSCLDYCNSLLTNITERNLHTLLMVYNSKARVRMKAKFQHITHMLQSLRWVPMEQRIKFQTCCLVYKVIHVSQPTYLVFLIIPQTCKYCTHSLVRCFNSCFTWTRTVLSSWAFLIFCLRLLLAICFCMFCMFCDVV